MIEGRINDRYESVVTISLTGPKGESREVDAVVDTGFNGFLVLPPELVETLPLRRRRNEQKESPVLSTTRKDGVAITGGSTE